MLNGTKFQTISKEVLECLDKILKGIILFGMSLTSKTLAFN